MWLDVVWRARHPNPKPNDEDKEGDAVATRGIPDPRFRALVEQRRQWRRLKLEVARRGLKTNSKNQAPSSVAFAVHCSNEKVGRSPTPARLSANVSQRGQRWNMKAVYIPICCRGQVYERVDSSSPHLSISAQLPSFLPSTLPLACSLVPPHFPQTSYIIHGPSLHSSSVTSDVRMQRAQTLGCTNLLP